MIEIRGLQFEAQPDGGVAIRIRHNATDNAEIVRVEFLTQEHWESILSELSPMVEEFVDEEDKKRVEELPPLGEELTDEQKEALKIMGDEGDQEK